MGGRIRRIFLIVLDSFGIGAMPDAQKFGDGDVNTLRSIASMPEFATPTLKTLGLFNIDGVVVGEKSRAPLGVFARLGEKSNGKDTTTGHWEMAGIISEHPMPTFPHGFPKEVIQQLEEKFQRKILCNKPYSGTEVIKDYGKEHEKTGALIVYTSADSVLQIAAHENVIALEELYRYCQIARRIMQGKYAVGRIIARPFIGTYPNYTRTPKRHDYSLVPPKRTILDALKEKGYTTISVGKIFDIFAGRSLDRSVPITDNYDGMKKLLSLMDEDFTGLCFVNLVDFDMVYGHRRDSTGYAKAMSVFDTQLREFIGRMNDEDMLVITADHGCDPKAPGTDHTREYVPLIMYGDFLKKGINLGTKDTFSVIAATIADIFAAPLETYGKSLKNAILA